MVCARPCNVVCGTPSFTQREARPIDTGLLTWLDAHREYAVFVVPLVAFAEACVGIGLFVSGFILWALTTALYSAGVLSLPEIAALSFVGATVGDHAGFYTGLLLGPRIHQWPWVQRQRHRLAKGEALIKRHGIGAVAIGRFTPAIRSLVPLLIGMSGIKASRYSLIDIATCALWSVALALLAYVAALAV